ncbi:hypothetical protein [Rivibacter subsaxonicus]|uniref:Lipoprotein n=1 Tax=Rivibacter subsaxonicus TaxID=457575 RepID=A0A4Q7VW07_9BURK|nr:hypothetical protein [Rivibacter subsaxonicus]RZU00840.1 hypothetical protein EV670_1553 [Rivibacter subsaxonicus]
MRMSLHQPGFSRPLRPLLLAAVLALAACGGAEVLIIPLFEFIFSANNVVVGATTYTVSASFTPSNPSASNPSNPSSSSGTFSSASLSVEGGDSYAATGSFDQCNIALNVGGNPVSPIAAQYTGRFTDDNTLVLTRVGGALPDFPTITLLRDPKSQRSGGCG